jgi:hypothetical protein
MSESTANRVLRRGTAHAALAALGIRLCQLDLLAPIRNRVKIAQKKVKYSPFDKLYDAFVALLAGAHGIVEINLGLRADPALQAAFGRSACAEQSVIQATLNAATPANVAQMQQALEEIYRDQGHGYRHDYQANFQLLDIDITGMPCGKKAAFACKGYFAKQKNRRGRQMGRVLATRYDEVVLDRLFPGKVQLNAALIPLVEGAEKTLQLKENQRARTILRVDAGGGTLEQVNWVLARGYQYHGKDYSSQRAQKLAQSVSHWATDPRLPERQVGWVEEQASEYVRPVRRIAVRCRMANDQWRVGVLLSTLTAETVLALTGQRSEAIADPLSVLLAYVYLYDDRGGGVETSVKEDKQGLGITKRNKKRFEAQEIVMHLGTLAHNVLVWARGWLEAVEPAVSRYGIKRLVRDVFGVTGTVEIDSSGRVRQIILNQANQLAHRCLSAFQLLVAATPVVVSLGQT